MNKLTHESYWTNIWEQRKNTLQNIKDLYKWILFHDFRKLLSKLFKQKQNILEIGSSPGIMLRNISKSIGPTQLTGIDYAKNSKNETLRYLKKYGINAIIEEKDIFNYDTNEKLDIVMSFGLIEHFSDPTEILIHHKKLLKKGGQLFVSIPNFNIPLVKYLLSLYRKEDFDTHNFDLMNPERLRYYFKRIQMTDIKTGYVMPMFLPAPYQSRYIISFFIAIWNFLCPIFPINKKWSAYIRITGKK